MSKRIAEDALSYLYRIISPNTQNQNVYSGDGINIDGELIYGDFRGMVCHNSEFQLLGGDGVLVKNNGYFKGSNLKTYFCKRSILAQDGGVAYISDSSSSYGLSGLIALETNQTKFPIFAASYSMKGKIIKSYEYDLLEDWNGRGILVQKNGLSGLWDYNFASVLPVEFNSIKVFENQFYIVTKGSKCGLYDFSGKPIIPIMYDRIQPFEKDCLTLINENEVSYYFIRTNHYLKLIR
jgi:hypothetical protein